MTEEQKLMKGNEIVYKSDKNDLKKHLRKDKLG